MSEWASCILEQIKVAHFFVFSHFAIKKTSMFVAFTDKSVWISYIIDKIYIILHQKCHRAIYGALWYLIVLPNLDFTRAMWKKMWIVNRN